MTRDAVEAGFERFLTDAIDATAEEFSVSRALNDGARGPGGAVVDKLLQNSEVVHRKVVEPELVTYRRQTIEQFERILDAVESEDGVAAHREEILAAGTFSDEIRSNISSERRKQVLDDLFAHHRRLGEAVEPLVASPESSFWGAARAELSQEQAAELVESQFAFTEPLRTNRQAFEMATTVDIASLLGGIARLLGSASTLEVEFTDEAVRAMCRAEQSVIHETKREVDRRFD